jgi:histidinol dehydrogenase
VTTAASLFRVVGAIQEVHTSPEFRRILFDRSTSSQPEVRNSTASIIERVRTDGDSALREFAATWDRVNMSNLEVPRERLFEALERIPADLRSAMKRAAENISRAHSEFRPLSHQCETEPGIIIGRRADPFDRVGIYAPGGRAAYPSSVLMGVVPARCAGVREIILCSPPGGDGLPATTVMAAAALSGVDRVFALGGAGAIAAMALGTESVPRVQKIVGPGNAFVAEAKLQLSGFVSIDSPAGPSELLIIADRDANPDVIMREMFAQAEHDPAASVVALCATADLAQRVRAAVHGQLPSQKRSAIIAEALRTSGAVIWYDGEPEALSFACEYAAEHLLILAAQGASIAREIRNTGTIFIGEYSSVAFGDYMTGANHVLPTGSLARSYSGLSTDDFVRWTTWQEVSRDAARTLAKDVAIFASAENLPAHAAAAAAWSSDR